MKKTMYEQIYEDIINDIQSGVYQEKGILPSEKELAIKYNVSRITTGKAMSLLTEQGIVERVRGKGTFVCQDAKRVLDRKRKTEGESFVEMAIPKPDMLGVIIDAFDLDFGTYLLKGIERESCKNNMGMLLRCTYGDADAENKAIQDLLACGCKGLLLMTVQGEMYNEMILKLVLDKVPVVLVDRDMKGLGIPCVKTDNYKATWELTQELINQGHWKICMVSHVHETTPTIMERNNAFRDCMMQDPRCQGAVKVLQGYNTTQEEEAEIYTDADLREAEELVSKEDCTAFISVEYKMGVLLEQACKKLGLKRKICVFDELHQVYNKGNCFMHVKQNEYQMGAEAVRMVKKILDGQNVEMMTYIPYKIVI